MNREREEQEEEENKSAEATVDDCFCCCLHKLKTEKLEYKCERDTTRHTVVHTSECDLIVFGAFVGFYSNFEGTIMFH